MVAAFCAALLRGQTAKKPAASHSVQPAVQAEKFVLAGKDGKVRGMWMVNGNESTGLSLLDKDGKIGLSEALTVQPLPVVRSGSGSGRHSAWREYRYFCESLEIRVVESQQVGQAVM